ncbi:hypothetical protein H634G_06942 [Metarhizium anisopliae BRIP 53293]|uniref:Uncharacterized protein n=1 Tax=Metarhizium anisopliae BRIP 53293 TaxID=1291518 RepID=A0A0D9NZG7_METAN|nr:hypothetical protein H634G_06942 [Metarhizium anisopliae BRIP 53293]KJK93251.1 hypothetical protein H633G_02928 [Metarhizium anisopliae BRIP 53284]
MAWELEGLISHLLIIISCAGEEGCAVSDIVKEIRGSAGFSGARTRSPGEPLSAHAVATIWGWLVARSDVSVGPNRKHNDRPVHEVLALIKKVSGGDSGSDGTSGQGQEPTYPELTSSNASSLLAFSVERIYVSEDTMWETITGHSVNYKRVPRSEWLLLLGIASTKDQGILQGDLGRLVDQDKRSVPKRTDSLVKKGYIVKRTTLVRGTKTSKLWLKLFAPPLPKETDDQAVEQKAEMNLSRHTLAANLEPVPWHTRWTGESMDFHALATTIMATTKEWQVIRLQDLKAKLGVLGMRWQMKIVSKICRFLNSCGTIQYVAAKLDNKLFKDCIRYNKDLSAKDWAAFLATGKRAAKPMKTALIGMTELAERDGHVDVTRVNGSRLEKIPPWSIDNPLPQKITKAAKSYGEVGLTNPEIYALTLGPTFNRYMSKPSPSIRGLAGVAEDSDGVDPVADQTITVEIHATNRFQSTTTPGQMSPSSHVATVKSWKRSSAPLDQTIKFSAPKTDQGLLFQPSTSHPRQVPILQNPSRHTKISAEMIVPGVPKEVFNVTRPSPSASTDAVPRAHQYPLVGKPDTGDTAGSSGAPSASHSSGSPLANNAPISCTKSKARGAKTKDDRANIRHYIERLLRDQNGVLLGGKLLWDHVSATWNLEYPEEPVPKRDECQSALKNLLKEGLVMEHWHMFRDSTRSFSKCQLLTLPGIDAFSPESLQLLDRVKNAHAVQESGGHPKIAADVELPDSKVGGRSRRLLAREVAVLHAPVYAAQIAAKKEQGPETRERRKRRLPEPKGPTGDIETPGFYISKKRKNIRLSTTNLESGSPSELPDSSLLQPNMASAITVQFLQPNRFLEQDAPDDWSSVSVLSEKRQFSSEENVTEQTVPIVNSQTRELFSPRTTLRGQNGVWAALDTQYFEAINGSFSVQGWMPNTKWFEWASFNRVIDKRYAFLGRTQGFNDENGTSHYQKFLRSIRACFEVEMSWRMLFEESGPGSAGPHNIWIDFQGEPSNLNASSSHYELTWPEEELPTQYGVSFETGYVLSSSSDDEFEMPEDAVVENARVHSIGVRPPENITFKAKRVALATRALTPLSVSQLGTVSKDEGESEDYPFDGTDDLMAAFIAVRILMGGADKAIDWGLLMVIFPNAKLMQLRRFWVEARKEQGPLIANFTRAFQERFITALEQNEIPMIDFDRPQYYDWAKLIRWTLQIPREEGFEIPSSRELFNNRFSLESIKPSGEDWRERFFHTQTSIFSRFEAVTAVPGVFAIDRNTHASEDLARFKEMEIARSWIKSLCSMGDGKYTVEEIRDKFFTLSPGNKEKTSALFKEVTELLTSQRIICKSKKPLLGGRPYRLNEGYVATLSKMAQKSKYDEAAVFKTKMDNAFRKQGKMRIPYTLSDGAMMALTNLNASGRIKLVSTNLPYIPFGFEPGNYESRKYPKSYYHFGLEAVPAEIYLYNEQIDELRVACEKGPPAGDPSKELPQWVDFFGEPNNQRWSEILGAFCFSLATRGSMDTDGIRSTLNPILDEFETV